MISDKLPQVPNPLDTQSETNADVNGSTLIVVRHGERLDEANKVMWYRICDTSRDGRKLEYFANDPPLTDDGLNQAETAARTVTSILEVFDKSNIDRVYSSKLKRAYQTAYSLAKILCLPLYVSSGLAVSADAVSRNPEEFEFASIDTIRSECPGIDVLEDDDLHINPSVPWKSYFTRLASKHALSVVVAHRETIRQLNGSLVPTPYCCIAKFSVNREKSDFKLDALLDRYGIAI